MQSKLKDIMNVLSLPKSAISESILVDLTRIEVPPNNEFICRYTFRVEEKSSTICLCNGLKSPSDNFIWEQYHEIRGLRDKVDKLWAIEPCLMLDRIVALPNSKEEVLNEITLAEETKYLSEEVRAGNNQLSTLLVKMGFTNMDLYRCFLDYLHNTYPSIYMNKISFQVCVRITM